MRLTNEHKLYIEFSIGCALKVLPIYEKKYPDNTAPRKALEAANTFLAKPSKKNRDASYAAYAASYASAAAYAAYAAYAAASYAASAAYAAAYAASYASAAAAYAAYAAASYAADAADAADAAYAASDAERSWQVKFLAYLNFKYSLSVKIRGVE